eukprot:6188580-Pleurochrysis_carterae.AAC.1
MEYVGQASASQARSRRHAPTPTTTHGAAAAAGAPLFFSRFRILSLLPCPLPVSLHPPPHVDAPAWMPARVGVWHRALASVIAALLEPGIDALLTPSHRSAPLSPS